MAQIIIPEIDYSRLNNIKSFKNYLYRLNDDLDYMFNNLTPEDNFDTDSLNIVIENENRLAEVIHESGEFKIKFENVERETETGIKQNSEEIELYVDKGNITNSINISTDEILIQGNRLVIDTENLKLTEDNKLTAQGTITATAGKIAGFDIASDNEGRYLKGNSLSAITAGRIEGVNASFKNFKCRGTIAMNGQTWNMFGVDILSKGLKFTASFSVSAMYMAQWSESRGEYTRWYPLECDQKIYATNGIRVGKNRDDSGKVSCLSVYSYFEGSDKPSEDGEEYSDIRLKQDIKEADKEEAYEFLKHMRPIKYKILDEEEIQTGFTAQDILKGGKDEYGIVSMSDEGFYSVDYMRFIPVITAALQYMDKRIKAVRDGGI